MSIILNSNEISLQEHYPNSSKSYSNSRNLSFYQNEAYEIPAHLTSYYQDNSIFFVGSERNEQKFGQLCHEFQLNKQFPITEPANGYFIQNNQKLFKFLKEPMNKNISIFNKFDNENSKSHFYQNINFIMNDEKNYSIRYNGNSIDFALDNIRFFEDISNENRNGFGFLLESGDILMLRDLPKYIHEFFEINLEKRKLYRPELNRFIWNSCKIISPNKINSITGNENEESNNQSSNYHNSSETSLSKSNFSDSNEISESPVINHRRSIETIPENENDFSVDEIDSDEERISDIKKLDKESFNQKCLQINEINRFDEELKVIQEKDERKSLIFKMEEIDRESISIIRKENNNSFLSIEDLTILFNLKDSFESHSNLNGTSYIYEEASNYYKILIQGVNIVHYSSSFWKKNEKKFIHFSADLQFFSIYTQVNMEVINMHESIEIQGVNFNGENKNFQRYKIKGKCIEDRLFSIFLRNKIYDFEAIDNYSKELFCKALCWLSQALKSIKQ